MAEKQSRRLLRSDEPEVELDPAKSVEFGGELYWVVGETAGGAPYGLTWAEYREATRDDGSQAGWARAKRLMRRALTVTDGTEPEVGRVVHIGQGLSRDAYAAEVESGAGARRLVVLLPRASDPERDRRTHHEAHLLARLAPLARGFRVPRPIALLPTPHGLALVREQVDGIPAGLRAGRMHGVTPWALVAELAAAVHAVPIDALGELRGHATRRAHGEAQLAALAELERDAEPQIRTALAWLHDHLPPDEPSVLLHGDLLGPNILLPVLAEPGTPPALIDWEFARRGDPAHDLAIVTRGVRKPFQQVDGFERLLRDYRESSSRDIHPHEVRFQELRLLLRLYGAQENRSVRGQYLQQVRIVLEQVQSRGG